MSSRSRRDDPDLAAADTQAGHDLAADADRPHEATDWRTQVAGGPPHRVADANMPARWHLHLQIGPELAREVGRAARADDKHPSAWVRDLIADTLAARTGRDRADFNEDITVKPRRKARPGRAKALQ